jgi:two-component system sensor histidine kinase PilS (NtrC family)
MKKAVEYTGWPLPEALTLKVVKYLNVYRIVIAVLLAVAHFAAIADTALPHAYPQAAGAILVAYVALAILLIMFAGSDRANIYQIANVSLIGDVVCLGLLVVAYGGIVGGIGILLVFTSGAAAILLPLRTALFIASMASLSMIGTALWDFFMFDGNAQTLIQAGLFGITAMIAAVLANQVAYWARDYRLIAERRKASLTELEQANELIIRRMRTGVIAVDENNRIRVMNESAWFLMGSPSVRERSLRSLSPRLEHSLAEWREDTTIDPKPVVLEPSQAQILPSYVALPAETGFGAMIFMTDNNVVARRAVELSVNSLAKLSGSIAHEIRNPLAALNHASQLLEESPKISLAEMRLVHIIQNHAKRMNGIIENVLQLSRREQSQPELVPLHIFMPEFANEFQTTQINHSLEFQYAFDEAEAHVLFDKSQLSQCLWKLLDNAADHAGRNNPTPRVRLTSRVDEDTGFCIISIADNGPGIDKAALSKIFEPFYSTRKEGSGLGLYIARQLCEANQAELTVDSEPGEGAYFHIRMALARAAPKTGRRKKPETNA